jgi:hypothetical protein
MQQSVQDLIDKFLTPPKGNSPEAIRAKLLYWVERANHPEKHSQDNSKFAIADVRRKARQNARRIITRYPEVAFQLAKEQVGA